MNPAEKRRYDRHIRLPELGLKGQEAFGMFSVLVIGAGGLGCPALQYLAAAGIGKIGVVDMDMVDESNLQRQVLFGTEDLGKNKADCAIQKISRLNPHIKTASYPLRITEKNASEIISGYDAVMDGSDNFQTRYLVSDVCVILNKPLISGSVHKFEGQLSVFNYQGGPTYRCLYPAAGNLPSCSEAGILGVLTGTIGCMMATELLKIASGLGEVLSGKLLVYNALDASSRIYSFETIPGNKQIKSIQPFEQDCENNYSPELNPSEFLESPDKEDFFVLDVREEWEFTDENLKAVNIPLHSLTERILSIPHERQVLICFQRGARSKIAVQLLKENGYTNVAGLKGGLEAVLKYRQGR